MKFVYMEESEKYSILYVDDEPDNLLVFRSALRRFYNVVIAESATEAIELAKNEVFAVIITDQRMPGITGLEFISCLPDEPENLRMILTGYSDVSVIIDAINTGKVYRYITKPWDKDDLKITIDKAVEAYTLRKKNKQLVKELLDANQFLEQKVEERTSEVNKQKVEIESLLLNILPAETAEELKKYGKSIAKKHHEVSVLFADIQGFTKIAEILPAEELVHELDTFFRAFDDITGRFGLEKIKTIGDAYMCAGGLPKPLENSAAQVVKAAMEMQQFMRGYRLQNQASHQQEFNLRIGIHTGSLVAGVVGHKKFAYDIWGDTVNTAARMEQNSEAGRINISKETYELIQNKFTVSPRGFIDVKNKSALEMFFVEGIKENSEIEIAAHNL
ncbi:MAG: adenylate/guanylate cyclase domain-containing response regulator [Sphingobacteriales bacterium]|nr:MAG: adenylate/guanylate cyclase domain-containing response regulator [Sphingobacteriales bacterium]